MRLVNGRPFRRIVFIGSLITYDGVVDDLVHCSGGHEPSYFTSFRDAQARFQGGANLVILTAPFDSAALCLFLETHGDPPVIRISDNTPAACRRPISATCSTDHEDLRVTVSGLL